MSGEKVLRPALSEAWREIGVAGPMGITRIDLRAPRPDSPDFSQEFHGSVVWEEEPARFVARVEGMGVVGSCLDFGNAIVAVQESFGVLTRETQQQMKLDVELRWARKVARETRDARMTGEL